MTYVMLTTFMKLYPMVCRLTYHHWIAGMAGWPKTQALISWEILYYADIEHYSEQTCFFLLNVTFLNILKFYITVNHLISAYIL